MAFDVNTFREAHRPWSFTVGRRTYTARHVSAPDSQRFDQQFAAARTDTDRIRALRWILRRAFPWRFSYQLRGDPVRIILDELEPAARQEALRDFFACRAGGAKQNPDPVTNGTLSPTPTPPRT